MADRDGEDPAGEQHGDVRKEEGGDGAEEDGPETPARRLDGPRVGRARGV
jgi:hypothetical protein